MSRQSCRTEQAIDIRLGLRAALSALGEALGGCSTTAQRPRPRPELGDQLRLGQVYAAMSGNFWLAGDVDRAIVYGQRALAVARCSGMSAAGPGHLHLGRPTTTRETMLGRSRVLSGRGNPPGRSTL